MKTRTPINLKMILLVAIITISHIVNAQAPDIEWQKCFGSAEQESGFAVDQCSDGGYVMAGVVRYPGTSVTSNYDYQIIKIDVLGGLQWQKNLGGSSFDEAHSIQQCSDGGYIIAGNSYSNNGDVTGNHGYDDYWIVKLDATGSLQWQKSFGGSYTDYAYSVRQCTDGGYIVAGLSNSINNDVTGHHGDSTTSDAWVIKLDAAGEMQWEKSFGGSDNDAARSVQQCSDGGYIIAGYSESNIGGNHGGNGDFWIVKLDSVGTMQWQKCYGGSMGECANSIYQCTDGGYIAAGYTYSRNLDITDPLGGDDFWVIKINATGVLQWQKCLGGSGADFAYSVQQDIDGGYIVAGSSGSTDNDVTNNLGGDDFWVVKLNNAGILQWQKSMGGSRSDSPRSIRQCTDGGYIVLGITKSSDIDVTGFSGESDYWIVKLGPSPSTGPTNLIPVVAEEKKSIIYPNPAKGLLRLKQIGNKPQVYTITDIAGRIMKIVSVNPNNPIIDISTLSNGSYILLHIDGTQNIVNKFMVEN